MSRGKTYLKYRIVIGTAVLLAAGAIATNVFSANITSSVVVGNSAPVVSAVAITSSTITLTANTTTNVTVQATVTDNNGCTDITGGTTTILFYRSGYSSSSCLSAGTNSLDCYLATAFTASSTCSGTSINATTTFAVQYFARATDASSSFPSNTWKATVIFKDPSNATGSADDTTNPKINTLNAINVTTSSINYGSVGANSNTGAVNQVTTTTNAGNSSTTLQLSVLGTLASGVNALPTTTSQTYSTSTFTFQGTSTFITASAVTVSGFFLTAPTSAAAVQQPTFWGLQVPNGQATGTYTGTNVFGALFQP